MNNEVNPRPFGEQSLLNSIHFGPGETIDDDYRIISVLGEGGMCIAFKAEDLRSHRTVAIKFLLPNRQTSEKDLLRFRREAQTSSELNHPSIAHVFEFAILGNQQPYLVMEYVEGQTLSQKIQLQGQLPIKETVEIFIKICDALEYAHSKNVLHRDIKPSNIIVQQSLDKPLNIKLLDFGIAKIMRDPLDIIQHITQTGEVVGSPFYMSPEQARGGELDSRSDLYSLGCALYEALTGGPPHVGQTPLATILKRETNKPITLVEGSLGKAFPKDLEVIVSKLLQNDPSDRYQSASEVKKALSETKFTDLSVASSNTNIQAAVQPHRGSKYAVAVLGIFLVFLLAMPIITFLLVQTQPFKHSDSSPPVKSPTSQAEVPVSEVDSLELKTVLTKGQEFEHRKEYPNAISAYTKAIDKYKNSQDPAIYQDLVLAQSRLASCFRTLGSYDQADRCVKEALDLCRERYGELSYAYANALTSAGTNYLEGKNSNKRDSWKQARPLYEQSVQICEKLPARTSDQIVTLLKNQAEACGTTKLLEQAQIRYEKALVHCRKSPPEEYAVYPTIICSLTQIYCLQNQYEKTKPLYKELLSRFNASPIGQRWQIAEHLATFAKYIESLRDKSKAYLEITEREQNLYKEVYKTYSGAYGQFNEPDTSRLGKLAVLIGYTYRVQGEYGIPGAYPLAETWYKTAKSDFESRADKPQDRIAGVSRELADVLCKLKRYLEAEQFCNSALAIYIKLGDDDTPQYGYALNSLAGIEVEEKKYAAAETHFSQAHEIFEKTSSAHLARSAHDLTAQDVVALLGIAQCKVGRSQSGERLRLLLQIRPLVEKFGPYSPTRQSVEAAIRKAQSHGNSRI